MLIEADELDNSGNPMSFVTGRIQAPQQPQLLKTRMIIDHSDQVVAMLAREQKVSFPDACWIISLHHRFVYGQTAPSEYVCQYVLFHDMMSRGMRKSFTDFLATMSASFE